MKSSSTIIDGLNDLHLESPRLIIKKFSINEVEYNIQDEMNPSLMKYIKDIQPLKETRIKSEEVAAPWSGDEGAWLIGAIRLSSDNSYIGLVCLRYESVIDHIVEIGWRLKEEYHSQGYATEPSSMIVKYAKEVLKVNKIMAYCDNDNVASIKVMNKLGMKREGLLLRHFRINNIWRDEGIFSLIVENDVG